MNGAEKRETLSKATKRAYRAARRAGKPIGWKQARDRGLGWCIAMFPGVFLLPGAR